MEENLARLRTPRNNIRRYRRLLDMRMADFERQFIEKRHSGEQSAMDYLAAMTFPSALNFHALRLRIRLKLRETLRVRRAWSRALAALETEGAKDITDRAGKASMVIDVTPNLPACPVPLPTC
jgi:hypothetical protein